MKTIKCNLVASSCLSAMVFVLVLVWGSPLSLAGSAQAQDQTQPQQMQPDQSQSKTGTFTGTVAKEGEQYVLHASTGATYVLDNPQRAKLFDGKTVKVTGQLDEQSRQIHVESIENAG